MTDDDLSPAFEEAKEQTLENIKEQIAARVQGLECAVHHAAPHVVVNGELVPIAEGNCCPDFDAIVQAALDKGGPIVVDVQIEFVAE